MRIAIIAALLAASAISVAHAGTYSALYTFGDSLVDSGNVQAAAVGMGLPDPAPAEQGYYKGRFSNGYNAADYLSLALFGHVATGALLGGTDFAFGGALAATNGDAVPDLAAQTAMFANATGFHADPNALYFINAGGNDGFATLFGVVGAPDAVASGAAIAQTVQSLAALGAKHFLVDNVTDLGNTPLVKGAGYTKQGTAESKALNAAITHSLNGLALPGIDLRRFNAYSLGIRLNADPATFGLPGLDTATPCTVVGAFPSCTGLEFFDKVHPTDRIYQIFGKALAQTVPEPGALALFGLAVAGLVYRRRG